MGRSECGLLIHEDFFDFFFVIIGKKNYYLVSIRLHNGRGEDK